MKDGIIGLVAVVGAAVLIFALSWVLFLSNIFFPANVSRQFDLLYSNYASFQAAAQNVCAARSAASAAPSGNVHDQRITQQLTIENNYNRIAADYNQAVANIFKAKLILPSDLPRTAPTLDEAVQRWC